jgi:hypothetical protein
VVFGAELEPASNGQMQCLRWRFLSKETKQPFGDIEEMSTVVKRNGKPFGPFTGRMAAREPGVVATQHILTARGNYEATLTDATVHAITFPFKIRDRKDLEIP